jgi:hypothetical protein
MIIWRTVGIGMDIEKSAKIFMASFLSWIELVPIHFDSRDEVCKGVSLKRAKREQFTLQRQRVTFTLQAQQQPTKKN